MPGLSPNEVSQFYRALSGARGQFSQATTAICQDYSLGPRGPWIIGLVGREPMSPLALAEFFDVGRSLITAELNRLTDAGLIDCTRDTGDGRRVLLTLTAAGHSVMERLAGELDILVNNRLSGYSRDQVMLCTQMLRDFATLTPEK